MAKRKRRRYTDVERASACLMLEAAGYPDTKGALVRTAKASGVPPATLHRWMREKNNPPPTDLVNEKRLSLAEMLDREIRANLNAMDSARPDANLRDLGVVTGILVEKKQLISGEPTERTEHISEARERIMGRIHSLSSRTITLTSADLPSTNGNGLGHP